MLFLWSRRQHQPLPLLWSFCKWFTLQLLPAMSLALRYTGSWKITSQKFPFSKVNDGGTSTWIRNFFCLVLYLPLSLRAAALAQEEGSWHLSLAEWLCIVAGNRGRLWAQGFRECAVPCGAPAWGSCWPENWLGVGREGLSIAQWLSMVPEASSWLGVGMGQTCTHHLELSVSVSCEKIAVLARAFLSEQLLVCLQLGQWSVPAELAPVSVGWRTPALAKVPNLKTKFACINFLKVRPVKILCRLRVTFRREVKLGCCRESRVWGVGLLANLCSLCTFNLCSVEETNTLWTSLKLEVREQRTIPFPCTIPCGLATWWAKAPSSCSVSAPALPASPLLLELDSLVSCCCFLAMLALRSIMVFSSCVLLV